MKPYISNTIRQGTSIYLLIPADVVQAEGIKEGEFFSNDMKRLVPSREGDDDPRD